MTTSTPKRTQCHGCKKEFASDAAFNAHIRLDNHKGSQCMSRYDMVDKGMHFGPGGYWCANGVNNESPQGR